MASTYLTVSIPYVNAPPHLGYAYELVLADIAARARRATTSSQVRFVGGTDDHSLKNALAAEEAGIPTAEFVALHAALFADLRAPLSITFDDFIQTSTDARHLPAVTRLWERVEHRGDLYRKDYRGKYCVGCEQFYTTTELVDGCCPEHGTPPETVSEQNWFFRLSAYQSYLEEAIVTDALRITPDAYRAEALAFVRAGLSDISISRSAQRARGWGIRVPGDPDQVIWVWFDALSNYLSALDYGSPGSTDYQQWWSNADERVHVIGKGILRFHTIYWPAFLASAREPLPTRIHVHPYLSLDGDKLSKSSGVTLDPREVVNCYGSDALRWWFARDVHPVSDTDFSLDRLVARANEDLAGGVANVASRIAALVRRYRNGLVPDIPIPPIPETADLVNTVGAALADLDLRRGSQLLLDAVAALNRDIETNSPWKLAKDPNRARDLDEILVRHVNTALRIATALSPILPDLSSRITARLRASSGQPLPADGSIYPRRGLRL